MILAVCVLIALHFVALAAWVLRPFQILCPRCGRILQSANALGSHLSGCREDIGP